MYFSQTSERPIFLIKMCDKKGVHMRTFTLTAKQICPKKDKVTYESIFRKLIQSEYNEITDC